MYMISRDLPTHAAPRHIHPYVIVGLSIISIDIILYIYSIYQLLFISYPTLIQIIIIILYDKCIYTHTIYS